MSRIGKIFEIICGSPQGSNTSQPSSVGSEIRTGMPYRVIPIVGTGSVVAVTIVVVVVSTVVVGCSDVVGAMEVTGIVEGADVLVVGTSIVVLDCCG